MLLVISNLSECNLNAPIEATNQSLLLPSRNGSTRPVKLLNYRSSKQSFSPCTKKCDDTKSRSMSESAQDDIIRTHDKPLTRDQQPVLVEGKASSSTSQFNLPKRLKRMDVSQSIHRLLSRLRPETPLAAFGYTPPPPYSQISYGNCSDDHLNDLSTHFIA